ncbi:MAG TPA: hypothetical protein VFH44_04405 [Solirubrobacterales bacterium]|nr:hypothetical protein [Solirubrobacterales bacterium]
MSEGPPTSGPADPGQGQQQPAQPEVPAGWYQHPTAPGWEAYWTGTGWGTETRPAGEQQPAAPEQPAATPAAEAQAAPSQADIERQQAAAQADAARQAEAARQQAPPAQQADVTERHATAPPAGPVAAAPAAATATPAAAETERSSALPMLLCVLGALVAIVGAFLPAATLDFGGTSIDLVDNSMVAAGYGIAVIAAAVLGAAIAVWAYLKGAASWLPILLGAVILAIAVYAGTAGLDVTPDIATLGADVPQLDDAGDPSTGIFAAGIGGLLMIIGGIGLARSRR